MAAYGRGDYSGGRYSIGAYLGALAIVSASTVVVAGDKIKDAQFEISSTSTVSIVAVKIASASVDIVDTSEVTVAGGISAVGNVDIVATSVLDILYNRIVHFEASIIDTSSVVINARKKWETEADTSETWTPIEDVSESWTTVSV
jgi:hypothetical protein